MAISPSTGRSSSASGRSEGLSGFSHGQGFQVRDLEHARIADPDALFVGFKQGCIVGLLTLDAADIAPAQAPSASGSRGGRQICSGSNYLRKTCDFAPGPWCGIRDGLYRRFIGKHRDYFAKTRRSPFGKSPVVRNYPALILN
ncbi:MAG: hypothetical protein QME75_11290 [Deltaproteobacteria bacterium]|nr:hypothetical protein [Deltaproteobacteria bacterium]